MDVEFFVFLTFLGAKNMFQQKCPNNGLVSGKIQCNLNTNCAKIWRGVPKEPQAIP